MITAAARQCADGGIARNVLPHGIARNVLRATMRGQTAREIQALIRITMLAAGST